MKLTDHQHFALDARVSSEKQDDISNAAQHQNTETYLERNHPRATIKFRFADVHTGTDAERPHLEMIYQKLRRYNAQATHPVTCLLYLRWDRFMRNALPSVAQIERFKKIGVAINAVDRWIDWEDAMSVAMYMFEATHAQQVSDDISKHVTRCIAHKIEREGIYPLARLPRIFERVYQDRATKKYTIEKSPAFDPFRRALDLIFAGTNRKAAWRQQGGREVLGSYDAFLQLLGNDILIGQYRGHAVRVPLMCTPEELRRLHRLTLQSAPTGRGKRQHQFFLRGVLKCPTCGSNVSSSSPRGRSRTYHYYVCAATDPRHYRLGLDDVHADLAEALDQFTLSAATAERLGKKAVKRSEEQRRAAQADVKRLKAEVASREAMSRNALLLLASGQITSQDRQQIIQHLQEAQDELSRAQSILDRHGAVLEHVLQSLQHIALIAKRTPNRARLTAFLQMAFPSGLEYDSRNRIFRTESVNAAFSLIPQLSTSCAKLKTRLPASVADNRVRSGWRGPVRTAASDLQLFWRWVEAEKLTA